MVLKIALQIATVLVAVLVANLDYVWHNEQSPRKFRAARLSLYVLLLVMLISGVIVIVKDEDQHRHEVEQLDILIDGNKRLEEMLEPFEVIAEQRYPNVTSDAALKQLQSDLSALNTRTVVLEEKTVTTVFRIAESFKRELQDGTHEIKLVLQPIGKNAIPIFTITCQTENEATITRFDVQGPTVPPFSDDSFNDNHTVWQKRFRSIRAGQVTVTILTDKDPGKARITIEPLEAQKSQ